MEQHAVLERRGALCGLIVTKGFRHILHLAEAWTPGPLFGFMIYEKPEPLGLGGGERARHGPRPARARDRRGGHGEAS